MEHNRNPDIEEEAYLAIEKQINELFDEWVLTVTTADVYIATGYGYDRAFSEDTDYDLSLIFAAIFFVVIYLFLFLGTFSPMFCRCWLAIVGLLCIGLSYTAGFGLTCSSCAALSIRLITRILLRIDLDTLSAMLVQPSQSRH